MSKAYKIIAHISFFIHEVESTGEIGRLIDRNYLRDQKIDNKIVSFPACPKEALKSITQSIVDKVINHAREDS